MFNVHNKYVIPAKDNALEGFMKTLSGFLPYIFDVYYQIGPHRVKYINYRMVLGTSDYAAYYGEFTGLGVYFSAYNALECDNNEAAIAVKGLIEKTLHDVLIQEALKKKPAHYIINKDVQLALDRIDTFFASADKYKKYNQRHRRGILLYGPPGTGKSSAIYEIILRYPDAKISYNFLDNEDKQYGVDEEGNFYDNSENPLLLNAEAKRTIIYLDEVEAKLENGSDRARKQLLHNLEDVAENTIVVATTNLPEKMGPEFYNRPGRFDEAIYVGYPTEEEIHEYLKFYDCLDLIEHTKGFNFCHINELIYRTKINDEAPSEASRNIKKSGKVPVIHSDGSKPIKGFGDK